MEAMFNFPCSPWQYWSERQAEAVAILSEGESISWQQWSEQITQLSADWYRQGVRSGDGVVLRGKNSLALLLAYLTALNLGARVLPLNPQLPESFLQALLPDLNMQFAWCEQPYNWRVFSIIPLNIQSISEPSANLYSHQVKPEQAFTLTLTSGSSGIAKAVVHTPLHHLANADGLLQRMSFQQGDRWLLSLPLYHISGQAIIWRWLLKGATLVVNNMQPLSRALADCTHASLVPTQLWRLLQQDIGQLMLKQVLLGGTVIPSALTELAEARNIACWCGYGMTEMASTVSVKRANSSSGVGQLLANRELRLTEQGEILLRGSCLALGYWKNNTIQPIVDSQGWYATRDKGRFEHNELVIVGRLDNLFFSGGEGIQPEDIEKELNQFPLIEQAFVIPMDDEEFGQRPVAIIQGEKQINFEELKVWLKHRLASFQQPVAYHFLPEELQQEGMKISRRLLKQWLDRQLKALSR